MKQNIIAILVIALFIYSLKIKISFSPFKISCEQPYLSLGTFFIILGIVMMNIYYDKKGYKRGIEDCKEVVNEVYHNKTE